jgi:4-amino-4-deoxy-L-arabinose transferase-like glycosyltransferase
MVPWWSRVSAAALPETASGGYWVSLVAVALLLRVIVVFGVFGRMPFYSDASEYSQQAYQLINHPNGHAYYWPVGTSYVLAAGYWLLGAHAWVARAVMILVSIGSVVTTAFLARRLVRDTRVALLAGWVLALNPGMAMQASQPFSMDVTLLSVNLTLLFALRAWEKGHVRDYALCGLALGLGALTRPSTPQPRTGVSRRGAGGGAPAPTYRRLDRGDTRCGGRRRRRTLCGCRHGTGDRAQ